MCRCASGFDVRSGYSPSTVIRRRRLRVTTTGCSPPLSCESSLEESAFRIGRPRSVSGWTVDIACLYTSCMPVAELSNTICRSTIRRSRRGVCHLPKKPIHVYVPCALRSGRHPALVGNLESLVYFQIPAILIMGRVKGRHGSRALSRR
jgi:hypothetical protein